MGKVGGDLFGQALVDLLHQHDPSLTEGLIHAPHEPSSYTIVINPPGVDRVFLHCPGPNDTYGADDVRLSDVRGARVFHFGYPPIMRRMFVDDGAELALLMSRVRSTGVTVSLDMSQPDRNAESGRVDWIRILQRSLPFVDIFSPSIDEIVFMLDRPYFDAMQRNGAKVDGTLLNRISGQLLEMGAAVVLLKLGDKGLYLRSSANPERIAHMGAGGPAPIADWTGRELLAPCFIVDVVGTTGSGDCTGAGFLTGLVRGQSPEQALTSALAVGASSVERADATSGVPNWDALQARIAAGWQHHSIQLDLEGWPATEGIWAGPNDRVNGA
jgi:sugar/nucleoside kinase (ribokinase family)